MKPGVALAALACGAMIALTARAPESFSTSDSQLMLPRAALVRILGRSHLNLVTDYFWIRSFNKVTALRTGADGKALLELGRLIVDLDPDFARAYWFIGINACIADDLHRGAWLNAKEAEELLARGYERAPEDNRLTIALAWNRLGYLHDYAGAAEVLAKRAMLPGAMPYFGPFATRLMAASGNFDGTREFAKMMRDSATDDATRAIYEQRLKLVDLEEILTHVEAADRRYFEATGHHAKTVQDLVDARYLANVPSDPFDGVIILNEGRADSTATKRLEVYER